MKLQRASLWASVVVGVFAWTQFAIWAAAVQVPRVAGEYNCHGTQSNDRTYDIVLLVTVDEDAYNLSWLNGSGEMQFEGIGFLLDDYLSAISIGRTDRGIVASSVLYRIAENRLYGAWTGGDGRVYRETCSKRARAAL
jgi:hypothetical protein